MATRTAMLLAIVLLACGAEPLPAKAEPASPAAAPAKPAPPPAKAEPAPRRPAMAKGGGLEDPIHRSKGPLRGSFVIHEQRFVAGEPIFVRFHLEAVGAAPLRFTVGGDSFGQGPLRFSWLVRDADDNVLCDLRAHPEPGAGGGGQAELSLDNGKTYDHWLAPQTGCDALGKPGRYRVRVARVLTDDATMPAGCSPMLPPDTTTKPIDDRGVPLAPECAAWLGAAPAVATELELEIAAYDRDKVKAAVARELAIEGDGRMGLLSSWGAWLCERSGCTPGYGDQVNRWLGAAIEALPEQWL